MPAAAIAAELARAFAFEIHTAGGSPHPMRIDVAGHPRDATTLAELRESGAVGETATIRVATSEGDVVVRTAIGEAAFTVIAQQRFVRMALALAFSEVPIPVEWASEGSV